MCPKRLLKLNTIKDISEIRFYLSGLKAVVFDLDDTLYSEKDYVKSGFRAISDILPNVKNAEERLWNFFEEKKTAINELLYEENIYSKELEMLCLETYRTHTPTIRLYENAYETLIHLKESHFFIGMITDGRPNGQKAKIKALNLEQFFDEIIITDELGGIQYRKPSPLAFKLMKERLSKKSSHNLSYNEMCYIGDNLKKDFIAPELLGMEAIYFDNPDGIYYNTNKAIVQQDI